MNRRSRISRPRFRPHLESLERRDAPAVLTVTNLSDSDPGSLRAELGLAQDADTINFAPRLSGTIALTSGDLVVAASVTVEGPGASVIKVSGNNHSRVFFVSSRATAVISGLTIADGLAEPATTPGIRGGGVFNAGNLLLANDLILGNRATAPGTSGGASAYGGGVYNTGVLKLSGCTVSGNTASVLGSATGGHGSAYGGGVASVVPGTLAVIASTIDGNTATGTGPSTGLDAGEGGGIYGAPSFLPGVGPPRLLTLSNSTVSNNIASGIGTAIGGGVFAGDGLTMTGSTVAANVVEATADAAGAVRATASAQGGGIYAGYTSQLDGSTITGNTATASGTGATALATGGGIDFAGSIGLTLTDSTVSNNRAAAAFAGSPMVGPGTAPVSSDAVGEGGGVYGFVLMVSGSTFVGNSAAAILTGLTAGAVGTGAGGGLYTSGPLSVTNSTLNGNFAQAISVGPSGGGSLVANGGGIDAAGPATFTSLTVASNSAVAMIAPGPSGPGPSTSASGGGIYASTAALIGTQIDNSIVATNTRSGDAGAGPDVWGTFNSRGYNLIGIVDSGSGGWVGTDLTGTPDSPIDPLLGPLQDNGGPTQTMELLAGSPALDAGDPALVGTPDQRGVVRGSSVSIGAYQATADHFELLTVSTGVQSGVPFNVTVMAVDVFGKVAAGYTGTIDLTTTDPLAPDLGTYTFTLADGGQTTFAGVVLYTPGTQTLTASDGTISGSLDPTVT